VVWHWQKDRILRHRKRIGFVPQDDTVHSALTVEENIRFSAQLRLPYETTAEETQEYVEGACEMSGCVVHAWRVCAVCAYVSVSVSVCECVC
jgi:ABC-type multidrug transport system ATPase subunit